jgi:hypothetical protein
VKYDAPPLSSSASTDSPPLPPVKYDAPPLSSSASTDSPPLPPVPPSDLPLAIQNFAAAGNTDARGLQAAVNADAAATEVAKQVGVPGSDLRVSAPAPEVLSHIGLIRPGHEAEDLAAGKRNADGIIAQAGRNAAAEHAATVAKSDADRVFSEGQAEQKQVIEQQQRTEQTAVANKGLEDDQAEVRTAEAAKRTQESAVEEQKIIDEKVLNERRAADKKALEAANAELTSHWREQQALHSWDRHEDEFKRMGINSTQELKDHISSIRNNPAPNTDFDLPRYRMISGKYYDGNAGTIVIDDPMSRHGGTAFTNPNISLRLDELRRRP